MAQLLTDWSTFPSVPLAALVRRDGPHAPRAGTIRKGANPSSAPIY
jgi:hypothetical protein